MFDSVREAEKPILGIDEEYAISAVVDAWIEEDVADSLAAILARRKFGDGNGRDNQK